MTKQIGALAGLALSSATTSLTDQGRVGGRVCRLAHDYFTGDAAQDDTVTLAKVDWTTLMDPALSIIEFDDFGTAVTLDVGDVTYPAALVNGQDIATAAGTCNALKTVGIANRRKPLWEMLGYASLAAAKLIGAKCELLATFKGGNPAAGTLGWTLYGSTQ